MDVCTNKPVTTMRSTSSVVNTSILARGSSMFPFVPSNSSLSVEQVHPQASRPGDVVAYLGPAAGAGLITHRLLRVEEQAGELWFITRGDALATEERVPASAVAYTVTHVSHRAMSYDTQAHVGRWLARVALRRGLAFRIAVAVASGTVRARASLRGLMSG